MKKLLVLFVVLSMASLANAALVIGDNGDGTLSINIEAGDQLQGLDVSLAVTAGSGTVGSAGSFAIFTMNGDGVTPFQQVPIYELASTASSTRWTGAGLIAGTLLGKIMGPAGVIMNVPVTYEGLTTFTLTGAAGATVLNGELIDGVFDTYTVPEPMTMTLLGLGGLALLRRKH